MNTIKTFAAWLSLNKIILLRVFTWILLIIGWIIFFTKDYFTAALIFLLSVIVSFLTLLLEKDKRNKELDKYNGFKTK